jgi:hypothetical protein
MGSEDPTDGTVSEPQEAEEYEPDLKIAVDGEVILKVNKKPDPILSDVEAEAAYRAMDGILQTVLQDEEEPPGMLDEETINEYEPVIRLWGEGEWDDEEFVLDLED